MLFVISALVVVGSASVAQASTFTVTKTTDTADGTCDSDCSLREAIIAANSNPGPDTITLHAGVYTLTLPAAATDAQGGDLDVTSNITINGAGAKTTIVDASALSERVLEVHGAGALTLSGVTLTNGSDTKGAGIYNSGDLTLVDSVVTHN